jgi:hypothetical protein
MAMRMARAAVLAMVGATILGACGKTGGGSPVAGAYHLPGSAGATGLELHDDGTFALRRESCVSSAVVSCGDWTSAPTGAQVVTHAGLYWPTPDAFPSAVMTRISLASSGRDLLVVGESEWAGSFTEHWTRGRACPVCTERVSAAGETEVVASARACVEPMPSCARM